MKFQTTLLRGLALVLASFTMLSILAACSDKGEGEETSTVETTTAIPEAEPLTLIKDGEVLYEIVYPKSCTSAVSAAATDLREQFQKSTGLKIDVTNDSRTDDTVTNKIIVGKTKHEFVKNIFSDIKYNDYSILIEGSNIILAAHTDKGYEKLLKHLKENVLEKSTDTAEGKQLTMKAENFIGESSNYSISSWKILGESIGKYTIIYADKNNFELVEKFRNDIASKCGYVLDIGLDTEIDESKFEILIGDTNRKESQSTSTPTYLHYSVTLSGSKLVIKAGGEHSLKNMFSSLLYNLIKGKKEIAMEADYAFEGNLYTDELDSSKPEDSDLRIMSCNILAEFESWTANTELNPYLPVSLRKEILFSALDYYQPTVIGFQELTTAWYKAIEEYRDFDKWELIKPKNPNRNDGEYVFSTVMYRKDLYTLVDSGMTFYSKHNNARCRCYTWVILKDKETGKEFCFASTHWDGSGREHGFLQAAEFSAFVNEMKNRCPVFTTGDFNANEITDEFKKFIADSDIYDAKYAAKNKVNDIGSWHNFTKTDISWGSCDHITATKDTTILKYQSLYKNEIYMASDHCWLIADIKFN